MDKKVWDELFKRLEDDPELVLQVVNKSYFLTKNRMPVSSGTLRTADEKYSSTREDQTNRVEDKKIKAEYPIIEEEKKKKFTPKEDTGFTLDDALRIAEITELASDPDKVKVVIQDGREYLMVEVLIPGTGLGRTMERFDNYYFTKKNGKPKLLYAEVLEPQVVVDKVTDTTVVGGWKKRIITF